MMAKTQQTFQFQVNDGEQPNGKVRQGIGGPKWSRLVVVMAFAAMLGGALFLPLLRVSSAHAQPSSLEADPQVEAFRPPASEASLEEVESGNTGLLATHTPPPVAPNTDALQTPSQSDPAAPLQQTDALTVSIISSQWAVLDSNKYNPPDYDGPNVFVVEAVVTPTTTATNVRVVLNYFDPDPPPVHDPQSFWGLVPGEIPTRTIEYLAPNQAYHVYWFASYQRELPGSLRYTVTTYADGVNPVSVGDNYYGNPVPDKTVATRDYESTGSSGIAQISADVIVGLAFTMTIQYELSQNPTDIVFSPAGNYDFDPSAYRLLATEARFYSTKHPTPTIVTDRLYFSPVPNLADGSSPNKADVTYTFIALTPSDAKLCPYAGVGYQASESYDKNYCKTGYSVNISGTVTLSMTKQAWYPATQQDYIQQNQWLTYTIHYTNNSDSPLQSAWIWDDVDPAFGYILTDTVDPATQPPGYTTQDQVAWYLGTIGGSSQITGTGTLTFAIRVDGNGEDLTDTTSLTNSAFFGINQGSLPDYVALTGTVTSTVWAPTIAVSKTDGRDTVEPGQTLTYTLRITNSGSITATDLVITDVLPTYVNYTSGTADPIETDGVDGTLVWTTTEIAPDDSFVITVPVTVNIKAPDQITLTNIMTVEYQNPAGWPFVPETAADPTTVNAPVLAISKSASADTVLAGKLITYTLRVENQGHAVATNVVITDVVPLSTTYETCSPAPCGINNDVISWTVGIVTDTKDVRFSAEVITEGIQTGDLIYNSNYGVIADQTDVITGDTVTTLVEKNAGIIQGHTFIDVDGNGYYSDTVDSIVPSIPVTLTLVTQQGTTSVFTATDTTGYYRFRLEDEGVISVTAAVPTLPITYFRTTAAPVFTYNALGITQTIDFGYAPITSPFGVIFGTVFEDLDHDGIRDLDLDANETGLEGVKVTSAGAATSPLYTDPFGRYTFRYNNPATVIITETNPIFYVSTTPDVVETDVVTGSSNASPIDFGDFLGIKITGTVFHDADVDTVKDPGEGGVLSATVRAGNDVFTTTSSGVYTLYVTVSDSHPITITERDPAGYVSTIAIPGDGMIIGDKNTLYIVSPISGTSFISGNVYTSAFGDVLASNVITISGQVWDDNGVGSGIPANGLRDGAEDGLGGAVVSLSSGMTQTTGSNGAFLLYALPNTAITITETNPDGYISTDAIPGNYASRVDRDTLVVSPLTATWTSSDNLFGDVLSDSVATIRGTVFDDENENGTLDVATETGISGVAVTLEISGGKTIPVLTDADGYYQFAVDPGTDVRITSAKPITYYPTDPNTIYPTTLNSVLVRPSTTGPQPPIDFGWSNDDTVAVILGIVFGDERTKGDYGTWDLGEVGLTDAVVSLTQSGSPLSVITTTGNGLITGTFRFTVTRPPASETHYYGLHEQNPPGYRSTTPDDLPISVIQDTPVYSTEFGDTNDDDTAALYGIVFDDFNCNGIRDDDEPGMDGVVITVTTAYSPGVIVAKTKAYGQYSYGFFILGDNYHTISEQDPARPFYHSTTPDELTLFTEFGKSYQIDFGDTAATCVSIMGIVFDDQNGDGWQARPGELGIPNVPITLSDEQTTTTGIAGQYSFPISNTGYYRVTETDLITYHSTTPNSVPVYITTTRQVYLVNFGDRANSRAGVSFYGTVFEDQDVNGARDYDSELGLVDVQVNITGTSPLVTDTYVTNEWGQFTFLIGYSGTYTVTETDPDGYLSTSAIPGNQDYVTKVDNNTLLAAVASITPGADLDDNLFGDVLASQVITISGYVWDDNGAVGGTGGDGLPNGSEPGLAGALVSLSSGMTQTTTSTGEFLLYAPHSTLITITELNPAGYFSINAIPGNGASYVDNDTLVVTSTLTGGSTSQDNLFGDILTTTLAIAKSAEDVDGPPLLISDTVRYTVRVTNTGTYTAFQVTVTDDLPDGVTYSDSTADQGNPPTIAGQTVSWVIPALPATTNNVATLLITAVVDVDQASQTITNTGLATSSNVIDPATTGPVTNTVNNDDTPDGNTLTITFPPDDYVTSTLTITALGITDPDATVTITNTATVQPYQATADSSGNFTVTGISLVSGTNLLQGRSIDLFGNPATDTITVLVDTTPLTNFLTITFPPDDYVTATLTITVMGTTNPAATVTITNTATGVPYYITATNSGSFTLTGVSLISGTNLLQGRSIDPFANPADDEVTVLVDTTPLTNFLTITYPPDDYVTSTLTITVLGTTNPLATVTITNTATGVPYPVTADNSGAFTLTSVSLVSGTNLLQGQSIDLFGNHTTDDVTVLVDTTPLTNFLTITNPLSGTITIQTTTLVRGLTNPASLVVISLDTSAITYTTTANNSGQFTVPNVGLALGSNTITATGTDPFGNSASDSVVVISTLGCFTDTHEPDDNMLEARYFNFVPYGTYGFSEDHDFHLQTDQDWLELVVRAGAHYEFATSDLGPLADTMLTLYASDGSTILDENDDAGDNVQYSRILWSAPLTPLTQTVYLAVSQTDFNAHDCNTGYTLSLTQTVGGNLDNGGTQKTVDPSSADLAKDAPVTYTITLSNSHVAAAAPVTVTDTLPITITLKHAEICGGSGQYVQYGELITTSTALTWVGGLDANSQVELCVQGTVVLTPWTATNTVWIRWNSGVITRTATGLAESKPGDIYLPVILKNQ
jgi:uncharacterized repeat protein (TIGR01451 family)